MKLDGLWDFTLLPEYPEAVKDIIYDDELLVPGCFDMDMRYKFARAVGCYHKRVDCGGFMRLEIGGLGLRGRIYVDGKLLGELETAYMTGIYRFETGPQGPHDLVVMADNRFQDPPSANFYEWYDIYGYGGIYRSIDLSPENAFWIDHLAVFTKDYTQGLISVHAEFGGELPENLACDMAVDGNRLATCALHGNSLDTEFCVPNFHLWSPETPHLHELTLSAGNVVKTTKFGIRDISILHSRLCLNGAPIKLLGYNRHDAHPDFGPAIPRETLIRDLRMIRDQGANFIRGSHYPQSEEMLDLCDRLGIMVWDESLGWGDTPESLTDAEFCRKELEQTRRMVRRSLNHPCIAVWAFLNELKSQDARARGIVSQLIELIHKEDPSRPVSFATCARTSDTCLDLPDIITMNLYPGWYYCNSGPYFCDKDVTDDLDKMIAFVRDKYPEKPIIIGEIGASASPGGYEGLRWSEEYQAQLDTCAMRKAWQDDRVSGLAIWQFCNNRTQNISAQASIPHGFNNKGVVDEYRRPKYAWFALSRFFQEIGYAKIHSFQSSVFSFQ